MENSTLVKCNKCKHYIVKQIDSNCKLCFCDLNKDCFRDNEMETYIIKKCYKEKKFNETNCSKSR